MTRGWPGGLIGGLWLLWALYWLLASQSVKPVRRREPLTSRLAFVVPMLLGAVLLLAGHHRLEWLQARWIGGGWTRDWIALALVLAGYDERTGELHDHSRKGSAIGRRLPQFAK